MYPLTPERGQRILYWKLFELGYHFGSNRPISMNSCYQRKGWHPSYENVLLFLFIFLSFLLLLLLFVVVVVIIIIIII